MKLREIYNNNISKKISFEVFPPKEAVNYRKLISELEKIKKLNPAFISLTCGAGGNSGSSTVELARVIKENGFNIMPHFTCVCNSSNFVFKHIKDLEELGIENILALRGDIPIDPTLCCKDFKYANELVEFIKENSSLSVGVAGYPEGHIEAENLQEDIRNLKKKIDCGAEAIFTQLFFDNNKFYSYIDAVRKYGINVPIIAGIMPILNKQQIYKMTALAKITVPQIILEKLETYQPEELQNFGIEYAIRQCEELISENVDGLHFFTLNKMESSIAILKNIL